MAYQSSAVGVNATPKSTDCCCFVCISHSNVGITEDCGRFHAINDPGCHCLIPCKQQLSGTLTLRIQSIDVRVPTKTKDNVVTSLTIVVQYQVMRDHVEDAYYQFSNPTAQISSFVTSVVRGQVPTHTLDEVFLLRDELQAAVKKELDIQLAKYGFVIVAALICDISPDHDVKNAMNQININQRLRVATEHKSEAEKIEVIKAAEADAESKRLSGVGLAEQRKAALLGLQSSVQNFQQHVPGMNSRDVMSLLLMNQYFDCVKDIADAGKATTIFMPGSGGSITESLIAANAANADGKKRR